MGRQLSRCSAIVCDSMNRQVIGSGQDQAAQVVGLIAAPSLAMRTPLKLAWRTFSSGVHSGKETSATRCECTQRSFPSARRAQRPLVGACERRDLRRTVWPCARNSRAQWCAPEQASMPITHGRNERVQLGSGDLGLTQPGNSRSRPLRAPQRRSWRDRCRRRECSSLPLPNEVMRLSPSHRGAELPAAAARLVRDGEVPSIR